MPNYEYKVVPAPRKGLRAKGIRGAENKFANALQDVMNTQAADGWEYFRTDTLPCDERQGLTGRSTTFQNMLVFRRIRPEETRTKTPAFVGGTETPAPQTTPHETAHPADEGDGPSQSAVEASFESAASRMSKQSPTLGGVTKNDPGHDVPPPARTAP